MTFERVKLGLIKLDRRFFKGNLKKCYCRNFMYRGKAHALTKDLYFPPHTTSNKAVKLGPTGELLAVGGDLSPDRMIHAYKNGIYPLFFDDQPILWWTSEIRCVLFPGDVHISKTMLRVIKSKKFRLTVDKSFHDVVSACSETRKEYTWITSERIKSSDKLHELGLAHSVEVWLDEKLVGGLYGVSLGAYFSIESMFSCENHTSTLAFIALTIRLGELNYALFDCGFWPTEHLKSLGVSVISRQHFLEILDCSIKMPDIKEKWGALFDNWDFRSAVKNYLMNKNEVVAKDKAVNKIVE